MQAGLMLDVLQPVEMPRWQVPQYWEAQVDALPSRVVEDGDEEVLDLIAAELHSEPDVDGTPESGVVDVSQLSGEVNGLEEATAM